MPDMTTAANDTAGQLARIRAKATGMGLPFDVEGSRFYLVFRFHVLKAGRLENLPTYDSYYCGDTDNPDDLAIAESLLAVLDPGAVRVPIRPFNYSLCPENCAFWSQDLDGHIYCSMGWAEVFDEKRSKPGPKCPGPAPDDHEWVMVCRRKVKVDG